VDNKAGLNGRGIKHADVSGLICEGGYKEFAIRVSTHTIQYLSENLHQHQDQNSDEPKIIYYFRIPMIQQLIWLVHQLFIHQ